MANRKGAGQSGRKGGSIITEELQNPTGGGKAKKAKKPSKGKQKK